MTATLTPKNSLTWHALNPLWQGAEDAVQKGLPHTKLAPAWQILLLGDGSPTRHLQLLTMEPTEVDVIDMSLVGADADGAPEQIVVVPGPHLRRQVWLRTASGQRLAYAASWWEASHVDEYLENKCLVHPDTTPSAVVLNLPKLAKIYFVNIHLHDWLPTKKSRRRGAVPKPSAATPGGAGAAREPR